MLYEVCYYLISNINDLMKEFILMFRHLFQSNYNDESKT